MGPAGTETDEQRLARLLRDTGAFQHSPDRPFRLASGATSPYYFDLRLLNGHPEGINAVARAFYARIRRLPGVRSVGGLESGSIPIATAISQLSYIEHEGDQSSPLLDSFYVRKRPKDHGARKMIEGRIGSPAVIVDDVITSGMSAITAVKAVKEQRHDCLCLMAIVFRGTAGQRRDIEEHAPFQFIFDKDQLVGQRDA